jgi:predicted nucleic acid-binding protein
MTGPPWDCVIDASVGIQLCIAEPLSGHARALLDQASATPPARFSVPDLFYVECANILWKHVRRLNYSAAQAVQDIVQVRTLPVQSVPTADLVEDGLPLALAHGISAYDACYLALAQRLNRPLVTADQALVRKLAGAGPAVEYLGNIPLPPTP